MHIIEEFRDCLEALLVVVAVVAWTSFVQLVEALWLFVVGQLEIEPRRVVMVPLEYQLPVAVEMLAVAEHLVSVVELQVVVVANPVVVLLLLILVEE